MARYVLNSLNPPTRSRLSRTKSNSLADEDLIWKPLPLRMAWMWDQSEWEQKRAKRHREEETFEENKRPKHRHVDYMDTRHP